MINMIINAIFWLINSLYTLILSPLFAVLDALFPGADVVTHIVDFLQIGLNYLGTISGLFLIPITAFTFLLTYIEGKFAVFVVLKVCKLSLNIYNKLKP